MKIGILTFHCAANYGAVFQTYGLQEILKGLGHEVSIVDYRPDYLFTPYRPFNFRYNYQTSFMSNLKQFIRTCLVVYPIRKKRNRLFLQFQKDYLQICPISDVKKLDILVFGSDQIWNTHITGGNFDEMFIGKAKIFEGKHLVAYAASVGSIEALHNEEKLIDALNSFDAVSVREISLSKHLEKKVLNFAVPVVLDPVLLAGEEIFSRIANVPIVQEPYLLTFQLGVDRRVSEFGQRIACKKGLKYIEIRSSGESINNEILCSVSPEEFLGYLKQADYVITSSFHGTALSILFKKEFNVISINNQIDERADMLLYRLGLSTRKIIGEQQIDDSLIDYNLVNTILEQEREKSNAFLRSM